MITFIISAIIVGIFSAIFSGFKKLSDKAREIELKDKMMKEMLPAMLQMEEMGLTVRGLDSETISALAKGRANKAALLPADSEPCTLEETIAACYLRPEWMDKLETSINKITSCCNVRIEPDIRQAVDRYFRNLTHEEAVVKALSMLGEELTDEPEAGDEKAPGIKINVSVETEADSPTFQVEMTPEEMDDIIEGLWARIRLLVAERDAETDEIKKLEIEEKIAHLKLEAAMKEKQVEELRSMSYLNDVKEKKMRE